MTKISDLSSVTDLVSGDKYVLARSGATKNIDVDDMAAGIAALYPPSDASSVGITDTGAYYTSTDVEGALQEIGAGLGGGGATVVLHRETVVSATSSIDITSISGSYDDLLLTIHGRSNSSGANFDHIGIRFNNDSGAGQYDSEFQEPGVTAAGSDGANKATYAAILPGATSQAGAFGGASITVPNYAGGGYKGYHSLGNHPAGSGDFRLYQAAGLWRDVSPITRVTLLAAAGQFESATKVVLYGLGG